MWTIGVQPASSRRLAMDFTSYYWFSPYHIRFTSQNVICQHSSITETTIKQHPLGFILFDFHNWESPTSFTSALFFAVNTYITPHTIVCSTSLTSFVHVVSISMLTNSRVIGCKLWKRLEDSVALYLQMSSTEYWAENIGINSSKRQSGIVLHKRIHIYGQYNF